MVWTRHGLMERAPDALVRRCERIRSTDARTGRGGPKKNRGEVIGQHIRMWSLAHRGYEL